MLLPIPDGQVSISQVDGPTVRRGCPRSRDELWASRSSWGGYFIAPASRCMTVAGILFFAVKVSAPGTAPFGL
jgi:hypothetical protein